MFFEFSGNFSPLLGAVGREPEVAVIEIVGPPLVLEGQPFDADGYHMSVQHDRIELVVGEFQQLGEIGIIAEYWNAYRTSCTAPDKIVATPHDQSDVRNLKLTDMVFEMDDIYVIKDMWLQSFPDTLCQFGHVLIKTCEPFRLGDCDVCKYDKNN